MLEALARRTLDLVLPPHALDGGSRPQATGLSVETWSRIQFIEDPACDGCGLPFEYDQGAGVLCPACSARPRAFQRARAACLYDDTSRELILKLKHADRPELAKLMALWLSRAAAPLIATADVVVPVPLHKGRLFHRRYNQAAEIGRPLARRAGVAFLPDALIRRHATDSQGGKSARGRRVNVRGAFTVTPRAKSRLDGRRVLLVDDVMTTGATAESCAKALLAAGASAVDVATVARVREAADLTI